MSRSLGQTDERVASVAGHDLSRFDEDERWYSGVILEIVREDAAETGLGEVETLALTFL